MHFVLAARRSHGIARARTRPAAAHAKSGSAARRIGAGTTQLSRRYARSASAPWSEVQHALIERIERTTVRRRRSVDRAAAESATTRCPRPTTAVRRRARAGHATSLRRGDQLQSSSSVCCGTRVGLRQLTPIVRETSASSSLRLACESSELALASRYSAGPPNTADKLRSGARVRPGRRGHEAACPSWQPCRRKLRQLHPLVRRRRHPLRAGEAELATPLTPAPAPHTEWYRPNAPTFTTPRGTRRAPHTKSRGTPKKKLVPAS